MSTRPTLLVPEDRDCERSSDGTTWQPAVVSYGYDPAAAHGALAEATPANAVLLSWARSGEALPPPQEWWDDRTNPFANDE